VFIGVVHNGGSGIASPIGGSGIASIVGTDFKWKNKK